MTGIGPVAVRQPRVRDRASGDGERIRYSPAIVPRYARRSKSLEVLIPILYLKGISTGDFEEALAVLLGKDAPGLSASTITRLKSPPLRKRGRCGPRTRALAEARSVSKALRLLLGRRNPSGGPLQHEACILVIIGATPEGKKELIGFTDGLRESSQSWRDLLLDLKRRGLKNGAADCGRRWRTRVLESPRRGVADYSRATLLGAQDCEHLKQDAEKPAHQGQARAARDLDGRDQEGCRDGIRCPCSGQGQALCRNLPGQIPKSDRLPGQGSRCAIGVLRLPCRALEALTDDESH